MSPAREHLDRLLAFWGDQDEKLGALMAQRGPGCPNRFANEYARAQWQREKAELLALREGTKTVDECKHACRFFNAMPAWGTYGT